MKRYCKKCGTELIKKQKEFCCHVCQASYALKRGRRDSTGQHWHWNEESKKRRKGMPGNTLGKRWKWKRSLTVEEKNKKRAAVLGKKQRSRTIEERKHTSEIQKTKIGPLAPNWQNGKSYEPYSEDFNQNTKNKIKERDNNICKMCGISGKEAILTIHHIDYNKENTDETNLITLCYSCHGKTNKNKSFYTKILQIFMNYFYPRTTITIDE